jgi:hypothetical protein
VYQTGRCKIPGEESNANIIRDCMDIVIFKRVPQVGFDDSEVPIRMLDNSEPLCPLPVAVGLPLALSVLSRSSPAALLPLLR